MIIATEKWGKVKAKPAAGGWCPKVLRVVWRLGRGMGSRGAVFSSGKIGDQERSAAARLEENPQRVGAGSPARSCSERLGARLYSFLGFNAR